MELSGKVPLGKVGGAGASRTGRIYPDGAWGQGGPTLCPYGLISRCF